MRPLKQRHPPAGNWLTHIMAALLSATMLVILASCQPQIIQVERPVTRVVEIPVEIVVEKPVEEVVTQAPERPNVAPFGSASASYGYESASDAIDGDPESAWAARLYPVQSIQVILDRFYLVDRIEMVVAQSPAGETSHHGDIDGCIGILACWAHVRLAGCPAYLRLADLIPLARHLQPDRVAHDFTTAVSCSRFLLPLARDGGSQISGRGKERLASTHNHQ